MNVLKNVLPRALLLFLIFTLLCGVVYTLAVTAVAQLAFPYQANGSIIEVDGKKYGSALLGQYYTDNAHMWGRMMKIDVKTYQDKDGNALMYSSPSNLTPTSEEYAKLVQERVKKIQAAHPEKAGVPIPVDLVTNSGSGLDPEISVAAAQYQAQRIAQASGKTLDEVEQIIQKCTNKRLLGLFGEETVNVLKVNLMLDGILKD